MKLSSPHKVILASQSPRRKELLSLTGLPFEVQASDVEEETDFNGKQPDAFAMALADQKAEAVAKSRKEDIVIGADTIVVKDGKHYAKPQDTEEAIRFLTELSGSTHSVITGVSIRHHEDVIRFANETFVTFRPFDEALIKAYAASDDPLDKAGGYGIQTAGALLIERMEGDYPTVVGLPVARLTEELRKAGLITVEGGVSDDD